MPLTGPKGRTLKAALLAIASSAGILGSLTVAIALSRLLLPDEYATYRQTFLIYEMMAPLVGLGLPQGVFFLFSLYRTRVRVLTAEMMLALLGSSLTLTLFIISGGAGFIAHLLNNPAIESTLNWSSVFPMLTIPTTLAVPSLIAVDRARILPGLAIATTVLLSLSVILSTLLLEKTAMVAVQARTVASMITAGLVLLVICSSIGVDFTKISMPSFCSTLRYSVPLALASGVSVLNKTIDKTIVSSLSEPQSAAIYINGAMEVPLVSVVTSSVTSVLLPDMTCLYANNKHEELLHLWRRATTRTSRLLLPLGSLLFVFGPEVMHALYGNAYTAAGNIFRVYLLLLPFRVASFGMFLQISGKTASQLYYNCYVTVANVILTVVLVRAVGPIGAAIATVVAIGVFGFPASLYLIHNRTGLNLLPHIPIAQITAYTLIPTLAFWTLKVLVLQ